MARKKKYTIPFVSLNGTSCRVDIYAEGYTGTAVTTLTAAANPLYYEEVKSEDVLEYIRYSTGYLRLIETAQDELNDLQPDGMFDRYVEVYYGSNRVWLGYIQQKEFSNNWGGAPYVRDFPLISPLGLAKEVYFPVYDSPKSISFKQLMFDALTALGVSYAVYMPMVGPGLDAEVSSLTVCPFNPEHTFAKHNEEDLFSPKSVAFFLEGLCALYGWMVREVGFSILFTAYNYEGQYMAYAMNPSGFGDRSSIGLYGNTEQDIEDNYTIADDKTKLSEIDAAKQVIYRFDGDTNFEEEHDYNADEYASTHGLTVADYIFFTPFAESFGSPYLVTSGSPDTGVCLGMDREGNTAILYNYSSQHAVGSELFWQGFMKGRNASVSILRIHFLWQDSNADWGNEDMTEDIELSVQITARDKHSSAPSAWLSRNAGGQFNWTTSGTSFTIKLDKATGQIKVDGEQTTEFIYIPNRGFQNIYVSLWPTANSHLSQKNKYKVEMKMDRNGSIYEDGVQFNGTQLQALFPAIYEKKIVLNTQGRDVEKHQNISDSVFAVNQIISSYDVDMVVPSVLQYNQTRLEILLKASALITAASYIAKQVFWNNLHWRIMAVKFEPWNDNYTFVLHSSQTI